MAKIYRPYPIVAGPTASGKTAVAVQLAKRLGGEVVSADSMQIYDGVSIGTARPDTEEMQGVPHHLLGFIPLNERYSVARYVEDAKTVFEDIYARGKIPVMCGGTGLYIQSFSENIRFFEQETNVELREALKQKAAEFGGEALLEELRRVDIETAARLHANDINRIVRALEVYYTTGQTISEQVRLSKAQPSPYTPCLFLLNYRDRSKLYERIDRRVDMMLENGLLDEVRTVMDAAPDATVLQAIGYKELMPYVRAESSLDSAVEQLKISTHHYAKRQISWFNRMDNVHTVVMDDYDTVDTVVRDMINQYNTFCEEDRGRE